MTPSKIILHKKTRTLEIHMTGEAFSLPAELLRVHSPSAEVQGHGPGQAVLQHGKKYVGMDKIEAVGNYGLRIYFTDRHDSGIFTWDYLYQLGSRQEELMQTYIAALHEAGLSREPDTQVIRLLPGSS